MYLRAAFLIFLSITYFPLRIHAEPTGRTENIHVRASKPKHARAFSGPYQGGEAITEIKNSDSVQIAGNNIPVAEYEMLHGAKFIPMLREMDNRIFIESLREADLSEEQFVEKIKARLSGSQIILPEIWGFTNNDQQKRAEASYAQWFSPDGKLLEKDFFKTTPPYLEILRWAYYYRQTNDPKWAAAVRDVYLEFYKKARPPAQKVRNASLKIRTMWHPLTAGSGTPMLVEAYALISGWPGLSTQEHLDFLKSFLERGRYLRYTTVPYGPWPEYSPFGYGNWILYQLQGLLAISATFPEFKESEEWQIHTRNGIGILADWLVLPDSGITEYSYDYANQITAQFEWCYMTFTYFSLPFPERFKNNILRLHELFLTLVDSNNIKIPFGDTARGESSALSRCAWAALAFLDGRFKHWANPPSTGHLKSLATMLRPHAPESLLKKFEEVQPIPPNVSSDIFPEIGWAIMRSDRGPKSTMFALSYRASEKVYHSGYETLGFNLWNGEEPLMVKLLGRSGYERGYPDGYHRTPRLANTILIKDADFKRESGSLRNWHSSEQLDYLEVDHVGWGNGAIRVTRRVVFLKPDWIVLIDNVDAEGKLSAIWQAHTGEIAPVLEERNALVRGRKAKVKVAFLDSAPKIESYQIPGENSEGFLLTATKTSDAPIRFITLLRVTPIAEEEAHFHQVIRPDAHGIEISEGKKSRQIWWEDSVQAAHRFVGVTVDNKLSFLASDADESDFIKDWLAESGRTEQWNGRLLFVEDGVDLPVLQKEEKIKSEDVTIDSWSGVDVLTTTRNHARISWTVDQPARHSILYRAAGSSFWQRQFQPGSFSHAWILLPDLLPATDYQIKAVSEFPDGHVHTSPVIEWNSSE